MLVESPGRGGIFDTNRLSLQAALEGMGYEVVDLGVVPNTVDAHVAAIKRGLENAGILLTTGGTSMGPTDLLKPVIERYFNGTIHFGRVTIKPGKPTTFATIPFQNGASKPMTLQCWLNTGNWVIRQYYRQDPEANSYPGPTPRVPTPTTWGAVVKTVPLSVNVYVGDLSDN